MAVDPSRGQDCPGRLMPAGLLGRLQPSESSRAQPQTAQSRLTRYQRHRQSYVPGGVSSRVRDGDGWKDGKRRSSPWWYGVSRPSMPPTHSRRAAGWWSWTGWHSGPGRPRTGLPTWSSRSWPTSWGEPPVGDGRRHHESPEPAPNLTQGNPRGATGAGLSCQRPVGLPRVKRFGDQIHQRQNQLLGPNSHRNPVASPGADTIGSPHHYSARSCRSSPSRHPTTTYV
jgi:hypothetical protein